MLQVVGHFGQLNVSGLCLVLCVLAAMIHFKAVSIQDEAQSHIAGLALPWGAHVFTVCHPFGLGQRDWKQWGEAGGLLRQ